MNGAVHVTISSRRVRYDLTFQHNISILRGDSGTGKSALCSLISEPSGVQIVCTNDIPVRVIPAIPEWKMLIAEMHDTLIFLDETCTFVSSTEFSEAIKKTTNYYVLITRQDIATLPYSVFAIYSLVPSGIYVNQKPLVINNKLLYSQQVSEVDDCSTVIVEDSGAGCEFWGEFFHKPCIGAGGNSNVLEAVKQAAREKRPLIVVVDAAAFGPFIEKVDSYLHMNSVKAMLLLPESFEWLLLHHACFNRGSNVVRILNSPADCIDYTVHFSFEQFYYSEFIKACALLNIPYDKGEPLSKTFLNPQFFHTVAVLLALPFDSSEPDSYTSVF